MSSKGFNPYVTVADDVSTLYLNSIITDLQDGCDCLIYWSHLASTTYTNNNCRIKVSLKVPISLTHSHTDQLTR